jgi:GNAT superfamily N-acetyltransferase
MASMSALAVVPVHTPQHLSAFLDLPKRIYADDPNWIAPLDIERRMHFDMKKNPFFAHAEGQLFLALENGEPVGRISAHLDRLHLARYSDHTGNFGFLEAVDREAVFSALLAAAERWLTAKDLKRVQGPFNFSINDECGLLVDGFHTPPVVMMGHARPYYRDHLTAVGYAKAKDLLAYRLDMRKPIPRSLATMLAKAGNSGKLSVRPLSKRNLARDLKIIVDVFNDAWSQNWNFVPMTEAEVANLGNVLRFLLDEEHVAIASYDGEPAAMIVTFPDFNLMCRDLHGKLLPFGWAKLLWRLKFTRHEAFRVPLLGVRRKYRGSPLGTILILSVVEAANRFHRARGTMSCEFSWILEDNLPMRRLIEAVGAEPYKTYRIYEKSLA